MPPRELTPEASPRMYLVDENGNSMEITYAPDVSEVLNKETDSPGLSFDFKPIEITISTNIDEKLIAHLIGLKTKDYRRMKKLMHIAKHTKSDRIRKKANKEARRIFFASGQ